MTEAISDEFYLESQSFRAFVAAARRVADETGDREAAVRHLREPFAALLRDPSWLPNEFARPIEDSGMGRGIASYLLYRAADRSLSVSSLVVSSGTMTPVHDHLAWGLVGLYRGEQDEEVFRRLDDASRAGEARLALVE